MGDRKNTFQEYCISEVRGGNSYASRFLKEGKSALALALEEARRQGVSENAIREAEECGMLDGSLTLTYEGAERIYGRVKDIVRTLGGPDRDYAKLFEVFDPVADHDLIATGIFCIVPEVRAKVGNKLENLYRVVLNVGAGRRRGHALPMRERYDSPQEGDVLPAALEQIIAAIPPARTSEDQEYHRMFRVLLEKKVEREIFPLFHRDQNAAFRLFDKKIAGEKNENLRETYARLRETYRQYTEVNVPAVNPAFTDPETGERGVLPSLHQRIALYHLLKEGKFGVFDGCGTGKTAIATLAQPLIEEQMNARGETFHRAVVVCPNPAKKAWKKGLMGAENERYLADQQDVYVINGERKSERFLARLRESKWIVVNYEQLLSEVNGSGTLLVDELVKMGVDYVIFDESHHIKSHKNTTAAGKPTQSAAARILGHSASHLALLSGSPIPDSLKDYAVLYHLLNPEACPSLEDFERLYQSNPRVLYTLFNEKTIRRTSDSINESLDWTEIEDLVELGPLQKNVYQYIVENRPQNWLTQARKALLDPRLVDPQILEGAGVLGNITIRNSAKYVALEEMLTAQEGPIAKGEKFIVFSSTFREGVTRQEHESLRKRYDELGLSSYYNTLGFDKSLEDMLCEGAKKKLGKSIKIGIIDGTIPEIEEREHIVEGLTDGLAGIICTTQTGGESLTFTAANHGIFLDDDYVPKTNEQAIARLIRKGQTKKVTLRYLRGKDTLDEPLRDYVEKKELINRIAIDGYPLTQEEKDLLDDVHGKRLGDLIKQGLGGVSIDVFNASIDTTADFEIKTRSKKRGRKGASFGGIIYDTTDAQRLMQWIGLDPIECWQDPEFVALYMQTLPNLAVPVIHRAKICNLIERAKRGELDFPTRILSEGSGPSLLYHAYQDVRTLVTEAGFSIPTIIDRDLSISMLHRGSNPYRIIGNMTGEQSILRPESFDMVDNESITLLKNPEEVKKSLIEANRVLRPNGVLELIVKNKQFTSGFYIGLKQLGFAVLSNKNEGFGISKEMRKRIREMYGEHFTESYAHKLHNTQLLIAQKVGAPETVDASNFWFETTEEPAEQKPVVPREPEKPQKRKAQHYPEDDTSFDSSRMREIITPWRRKKGMRPPRGGW